MDVGTSTHLGLNGWVAQRRDSVLSSRLFKTLKEGPRINSHAIRLTFSVPANTPETLAAISLWLELSRIALSSPRAPVLILSSHRHTHRADGPRYYETGQGFDDSEASMAPQEHVAHILRPVCRRPGQ